MGIKRCRQIWENIPVSNGKWLLIVAIKTVIFIFQKF
jgi:hypothetical protein